MWTCGLPGDSGTAPIALTMGDPAGIGGEISLKAWLNRHSAGGVPFFVVDSPDRLRRLARRLELDVPVEAISEAAEAAATFEQALPVLPIGEDVEAELGRPDRRNAAAIIGSIDIAVALTRSGDASAIVTNPISKEVLLASGFRHAGHTDYLGELAGGVQPEMMLVCPGLRVVPLTVHLPLRAAIDRVRREAIVATGMRLAKSLEYDFGIAQPRIVVTGLNPHAGENGTMGREEVDEIAPAIADLRERGIDARGPHAADSLFHAEARRRYDAALCMYHDQALIPLKTIDFDGGVNFTIGLPFVRTSPDHGTAFDIAAAGIARESSLLAALDLAGKIAARRRQPIRGG